MALHDSKKRSIAKALSWRFVATFITMILVWLVTGDLGKSAGIGLVDATIKLLAYYGHERLWSKLSFGLIDDSVSKGAGI